jgi:hypothetical protein
MLIDVVGICVFGGVVFLWKEEGWRMEGAEQKVNRNNKWLWVHKYIVPTQKNDKNLIDNSQKPACNILVRRGALPYAPCYS